MTDSEIPAIETAIALSDHGQHEQADEMLMEIMHAQSDDMTIQMRIGHIFKDKASRRNAALDASANPTTKKILNIRKLENLALGRFEAVLRAQPDNVEAMLAIASIKMTANRFGEAFEYARRALTVDGHSADGWSALGNLYRAVFDTERYRICLFNAQMAREGNFAGIKQEALNPATGINPARRLANP